MKKKKMVIGDAMQLSIDSALQQRRERKASCPYVVDATTSVAMRSKNLMRETWMRERIREERAERIAETFLLQTMNR